MNFLKLKQLLTDQGEPNYRYDQIASEVILAQAQTYDDFFSIPKSLRLQLKQDLPLISVSLEKILISNDKKSYKALLNLSDGNQIETVQLNPKPGLWSVCISTQVGCAMGCKFCATGKMGLIRNLTAEEITDQILFWKRYIAQNKLKIRVSNIVYMGMGEPFANKDSVFASINILTDPKLFNIGSRHLSVSTCGLYEGIMEFADKFPQVNLAISLHAPNQALRESLMPIAQKYNLNELFDSLKYYLDKNNRQLFFEYILLNNINDQDKDAIELANLLTDNFQDKLHLVHVNLIVYNPTDDNLKPTEKSQAEKFKRILENFHIGTTIRKSLGQEIKGACGQLTSK